MTTPDTGRPKGGPWNPSTPPPGSLPEASLPLTAQAALSRPQGLSLEERACSAHISQAWHITGASRACPALSTLQPAEASVHSTISSEDSHSPGRGYEGLGSCPLWGQCWAFQSPSSGSNWSLTEPRGSWVNIWIICRQWALPPPQRQQLHSWRRCEASERNCRAFCRQPAVVPARSRQLGVPGGALGSPSLVGVEEGSKAGTLGESRAHRDLRPARCPICSRGTVRSPPCDGVSGRGENQAWPSK